MKTMERKRKQLVVLSLLLALIVALAGCGGGQSASDADPEPEPSAGASGDASQAVDASDTTLRVGTATDMTSLDYAFNYTFANFPVIGSVNDYLLRFDNDGNIQPSLCTSWEAVDNLTYVYQIRDDAVFADGAPMTVDDVVYSMQRLMDPNLASDLLWAFASVASIEATGECEVTVRLSEPDACWQYIPATPGGQVASKAYLESHPDDYGSPDGLSLGTGPYKVESWKTGSEIVLVKNEYYWGEEPQFDEVVVSVISDESAMAMAMDSGQIDFCILQSNDLASSYEDSDACDIYAVDGPGNTLLSFNCGAGPCADENLRKAIASCVDIQGMISAQYGDYASLGTAIPFGEILYILDPQGWKDAVSKMSAYEFDLEKAKEYLEKSSYNGEPVEFNIIENNNAYANMAQLIQANCAMIGINIEIIKLTMSEYYANAYGTDLDADGNRKYDMMINRWTPDYLDPAGDLVPFFGSDNIQGGANYAAYSNPEVDALLKRQAISADNKERSDLMIEACQIATEECPYKALCFPKTIYARSNRVAYDLPGFYLYTINFRDFTLGKR